MDSTIKASTASASDRAQHNARLYRAEISPVSLPRLNQQFAELWAGVSKSQLDVNQLLSAINALPELRGAGVKAQLSNSRWPAAFQPDQNNLVIHPELLRSTGQEPLARLYALTEIFDQVIYAQLHIQKHSPEVPGILPLSGEEELAALLAIKAKKQEALRSALTGRLDSDKQSEQPVLVDPMSAWLLASPRYGLESECVKAFERAVMQIHR